MGFELFLKKIAEVLVAAGVPAEDGPMAALALVYLVLTLFSLLVVALLLKRNLKSSRTRDAKTVETSAEQVDPEQAQTAADALPATENTVVAVESQPPVVAPVEEDSVSLFQRMRHGLAKTRGALVGRMDALLGSHEQLDGEFLEELEEVLITADFGMQVTQELVKALTSRLREIEPGDSARLHKILG